MAGRARHISLPLSSPCAHPGTTQYRMRKDAVSKCVILYSPSVFRSDDIVANTSRVEAILCLQKPCSSVDITARIERSERCCRVKDTSRYRMHVLACSQSPSRPAMTLAVDARINSRRVAILITEKVHDARRLWTKSISRTSLILEKISVILELGSYYQSNRIVD
jgi:hypothetical protein